MLLKNTCTLYTKNKYGLAIHNVPVSWNLTISIDVLYLFHIK